VAAFAPRAGRSAGGVCHARRIHPPTIHEFTVTHLDV